MDLQALVERLMAQHRDAFARLHGEVQSAYDEAAARLSDRFPDPKQILGGALCGLVRAVVLDMNGLDALSGIRNPPRTAPQGASCGPGSTLRMSSGPNSSVRLGDSTPAWTRVRKLAPNVVKILAELSPKQMPDPKPGTQMVLDEGHAERVLGPAGMGQEFELIVFWWPTADKTSVAGAILAAVADIDTSEERILAFTALPAAVRPKTAAEEQPDTGYEPRGDFEKFFPEKSSETGDSGA
jgi:hypothetical protein